MMLFQDAPARDLVYTATEITTFIIGLGVLVTALGGVIVNIIVALRQGRKTDDLKADVAKVYAEAQVITGHVNSAATAANAKIEALQKEVAQMRETANEMKNTAALLAQALATNRPMRATDRTTDSKSVDKLKQIEANTAATVEVLKDQQP